jgi:hypothetical protein
MKRKKFTTMVDPDILQQMKIQAAIEGRSLADILEELLREYLRKLKK